MTFDEKTLRSVIEEVIREMAGQTASAAAGQAPAPAASAPVNKSVSGRMTLTEQGDAPKG